MNILSFIVEYPMRLRAKFLIGALAIWTGCIDRVDLSLPASEFPIIVDGVISDAPKEDTVKIRVSRAFQVDGVYHPVEGVRSVGVVITDNTGASYILNEDTGSIGTYWTTALQGTVGRTYKLSLTTSEGAHFESTAETMLAAGTVDSIYFEVVQRKNKSKNIDEEGFNIYINAKAAPGSSLRMRWKFDGTYQVITNPDALITIDPFTGEEIHLACAAGCLCCVCYVSEKEESPIMTNTTFVGASEMSRVFMKYIPINNYTFNQKYHVEITQMEVSQAVYDFYRAVKGQAENASSLFQPPFFELKGNITATNNSDLIVGIFSAAAVSKRSIYILRSDIGHTIVSGEIIGDCRAVAENSSTTVPPFWQ